MRKTSQELKTILSKIDELQIDTLEKLEHSGIEFKLLAKGLDREVYELIGTPWILKMSREDNPGAHRQWKNELNCLMTLRHSPAVRKYLPAFLWVNKKKQSAVFLKYEVGNFPVDWNLVNQIQEEISVKSDPDFHDLNIGRDAKGRYKIIDWGYAQI